MKTKVEFGERVYFAARKTPMRGGGERMMNGERALQLSDGGGWGDIPDHMRTGFKNAKLQDVDPNPDIRVRITIPLANLVRHPDRKGVGERWVQLEMMT